ncbi:MAG: hypothetical protein WDA07_02430 [Leucobacter sp.]|jgi:hypothetical protein
MDNWWVNAVWSVTPTVLIGIFFFFVIRVILRADRTERRVYQEIEAEERAKAGLPPRDAA